MATIPLRTERLAMRLGVGPLQQRAICHGYANVCTCLGCKRRAARIKAKPAPAQPWDVTVRRAA